MRKIKVAIYGLLAAAAAVGLAAAPAQAQAPASAQTPKPLKVSVDSFKNGKRIPDKYAFCNPAAQGHTQPGADISPKISWSKGPAGTKSYVIIASDPDVPTIRTDMNQEGKTLSATMPRRTFFHWVLVDIPAKVTSLPQGAESSARTVHGKPATPTKAGVRGLNDFTAATAANEAMKGQYYGYDGPCPPWNDEIVHHYHFTVYALSVASLNLPAGFGAAEALAAMKGVILTQGDVVGLYAQNPDVIAKMPK